MIEVWYAIVWVTLGLYVIFDGRNIGAGAMHLVMGKNDADRRTIISAIGPFWQWHEVWLISAGGILVLAFPAIIAAAFSGFYLAMMLVLWVLIGRGVAIELAGHASDQMWRSFWDAIFVLSNVLAALLFGLAFANIVRGVPIGPDGIFRLPLFTDFGIHGEVGIFDWYTLPVGLFALICLQAYGASFIVLRTTGRLNQRALAAAKRRWTATFVLLPIITVMTWCVRPELFSGAISRPLGWLCILLIAGGIFAVVHGLRTGGERGTFLGGSALILGLLAGAAVGIFPVVLKSTLPGGKSLTVFDGGSSDYALRVGICWWSVAFILTLTYNRIVALYYHGKVNDSPDQVDYGTLSGPMTLPEAHED